ncbi:MAG: type II toxin-antitoxin system RelE/ParE family toxin [Actinomycetota bacterium]|nr:type II toxin-antitoxin system RelE/ParE family toxin [Actinomycetota bacterium]
MARKYEVKITVTAENDIKSTFDHLAHDNPQAAAKWVTEIERQIDSLELFPQRCPVIPELEELGHPYRHLIYVDYRTVFRIEGSTVIILRVIHGARLLDLRMFEK